MVGVAGAHSIVIAAGAGAHDGVDLHAIPPSSYLKTGSGEGVRDSRVATFLVHFHRFPAI
jgi:hypothetical protein